MAQSTRRPTVLVVEDDPLICHAATAAFEADGFTTLAVSAAEDALGLAVMDVEFDALFTDIELAGPLDGWELAAALREMRPDLPVVYASGCLRRAGERRRVSGSASVPKPYDFAELGAVMRRLIGAGAPTLVTPAFPRARETAPANGCDRPH